MAKAKVAVLAGWLVACAQPAPPPVTTPPKVRTTTTVTPHLPPADPCLDPIDLRDLLARHAAAFGSEAQVEALSPRRVSATMELKGSTGTLRVVYDGEHFSSTSRLGGFTFRGGIDAGPWSLGPSGVVQRLEAAEAIGTRYQLWLDDRRYLSTLDAARDQVRCERAEGGARAIVSAQLPELGNPELVFDKASATLLSAHHRSADGERSGAAYTAWSAPIDGVRWPSAWTLTLDEPVLVKDAQVETQVVCDSSCFALPADLFTMRWPKAQRVSVPVEQKNGQLVVKVSAGKRTAWAKLDSSAMLSVLDGGAPLGAGFKPTLEVENTYAPGRSVRIGVLENVSLGGLGMPELPVVSVARSDAAAARHELVLGSSLFAAAAVRIDYEASKLVLAPRSDVLRGPSASALPLHVWDDQLVVEVAVDGQPRFVELDTGEPGGLIPSEDGARPGLSGVIGNEALAGCAAVVIDLPGRKLWLEPPCEGPLTPPAAPSH